MKEMVYNSNSAEREILDEGYIHGYHYCIVSLGSHVVFPISAFPRTLSLKRCLLCLN